MQIIAALFKTVRLLRIRFEGVIRLRNTNKNWHRRRRLAYNIHQTSELVFSSQLHNVDGGLAWSSGRPGGLNYLHPPLVMSGVVWCSPVLHAHFRLSIMIHCYGDLRKQPTWARRWFMVTLSRQLSLERALSVVGSG